MAKRNTPDPRGVEHHLGSVTDARAYLARHPRQDFIGAMYAEWESHLKYRPREPRTPADLKKFRGAAIKALKVAGLPMESATGQALARTRAAIQQDVESSARPFFARLATEPKDGRLALLLAAATYTLREREVDPDFDITGALAAAFAVALGVAAEVERPRRRRPRGQVRPCLGGEDRQGAALRCEAPSRSGLDFTVGCTHA